MREPIKAQEFKLSEPGAAYSDRNADLMAYLQSYGLPYPPLVRYGNLFFESSQKHLRVKLFGQAWVPESAIGTVVLVHGFSEHTANYPALIHDLINAQYAVTAIDLRGHGLSEGPRGHVDNSTCLAEDIEAWINIVLPYLTPSAPLYFWAHSMGAQACLQVIMRNNLPKSPAAVVLSSPMLGYPRLPFLQNTLLKLAPTIAKLFPAVQFPLGLPDEILTSNRAYLEKRRTDPLINSVATPQWVVSMQTAMPQISAAADLLRKGPPTLLMLAGDERLVDLLASRSLAFAAFSSTRHKVIEFPGARHELEKDSVRNRVVAETMAWLRSHR